MPAVTSPVWPKRLEEIDSRVQDIRLHTEEGESGEFSQGDEYCDVVLTDGETKRIRFHDYADVYSIPGLYETLFYGRLKCCSPSRVAGLLEDVLADFDEPPADLRVLDLGAGNGMVADELAARGTQEFVGVDIIPEAKESALRDRPGLYDEYLVVDFTELPEETEAALRKRKFNCLVAVAALGIGHLPARAFLQALELVEPNGWVAYTIREDFLRESDDSGFSRAIRELNRSEILQMQALRRFQHRLSVKGEPLYYVAIVARKLKDLPKGMVREW